MGAESRSARNRFAATALDRSGDARDRAARGELDLSGDAYTAFFISLRGEVLLDAGGRFAPAHAQARALAPEDRLFLGTSAGIAVVAVVVDADQRELTTTASHRWVDLRQAALMLSAADAGYAAYARALVHWHARHRYCGACGSTTHVEAGGNRRKCDSADCASEHFPRLDPAIIVLVEHQGRCLLGRQASWPERRYSVLAGFVEPGESLEDALRREVYEEAGVEVVECEYHSSQPWPFPSSLMLGFTARTEHDQLRYGDELEHAAWFSPAELLTAVHTGRVRLPPPVSLSARLLEDWYAERTGRDPQELFAQRAY